MSTAILLAAGALVAIILMAIVWVIQYRYGDAGIVDVAWGLGVALLSAGFLYWGGEGLAGRRLVAGLLISLWAIRLSGHVWLRLLKSREEDGRYRDLKAKWGSQAQLKLFGFFQMQAFGCWLFALPLWFVSGNATSWNVCDLIAVVVWIIAMVGEASADAQLDAFRLDPANRGQVCRRGWWYYSRHPNYFFEWLHWWTYVFLAWHAPWGGLTLLGPLAMGYFIGFVTGIPPTEAQAIRSRGDAYREYQRTTSAFFPWFPKA